MKVFEDGPRGPPFLPQKNDKLAWNKCSELTAIERDPALVGVSMCNKALPIGKEERNAT
jgi:hypothetical protein